MKKTLIIIGVLLTLLLPAINVLGSDTGWTNPSSNSGEWTNGGNCYTSNNVYATANNGSQHNFSGFTFTYSDEPQIIYDGIIVSIEAKNNKVIATQLTVKLSWDGGTSYTSTKTTASYTSEVYLEVGSSTDDWGHTWTQEEIDNYFVVNVTTSLGNALVDHVRVKLYYSEPDTPPASSSSSQNMPIIKHNCSCVNLTYNASLSSNWYMISQPCCNDTLASNVWANWTNASGKLDSIVGWNAETQGYWVYLGPTYPAFDFTIRALSGFYVEINANVTICYDCESLWTCPDPPPCNSTNLTLITNMTNVWNNNATKYNSSTGWTVWVNASSSVTTHNNTVNCSITIENVWNYTFAKWDLFVNGTCDCGEIPECSLKYINFSNDDLTINITYYGCNNTNTTNGTVNEDNWLEIAGFSFESGELGLLIVFVIFSLAFVVDRDEKISLWKPILLFLDTPLSLAVGVSYLGNTTFSVEWWVGIFFFAFAVILAFGGLYYSLAFARSRSE